MYYHFNLIELPKIHNIYSVTRNTVWQIIDKHNIMLYIKEGECKITLNNHPYHLVKGDLFFIPANTPYIRTPIGTLMCTMIYIHFSFSVEFNIINHELLIKKISEYKSISNSEILSGSSSLLEINDVYIQNQTSISDNNALTEMICSMTLLYSNRQLMSSLQLRINLCSIISHLSQKTLGVIDTNITLNDELHISENLKKAIEYIIQHNRETISLDSISNYCHISKQQLIRYFKRYLNTTPLDYITNYKIFRAKELLFNHSDLTVKEISSELGFDNQHYFAKVFKKVTGETPTNYRIRTSTHIE